MKALKRTAVTLLFLAAAAIGTFYYFARQGLSAREKPPAAEVWIARLFRHLGVPSKERELKNPIALTPDGLTRARGHFADHCASCHGNDGRGQTTLGRNMYPPAPDMTLSPTQSMSDGEIFYAIKNGVRLTGMPAWGENTPEDDESSWELVHFIRHLPKITPEEVLEMEGLNPKSPAEFRRQEEERQFLEGGGEGPAEPPRPGGGHH